MNIGYKTRNNRNISEKKFDTVSNQHKTFSVPPANVPSYILVYMVLQKLINLWKARVGATGSDQERFIVSKQEQVPAMKNVNYQ